MDKLYTALIGLELLAVLLVACDVCAVRRFSRAITYLCLCAFTAAVVGVCLYLLHLFPAMGGGNGLFTLVGLLFLIPIGILYVGNLMQIFSVLCTALVYDTLVFGLSTQICKIFIDRFLLPHTLVIQSLLIAATGWLFIYFIRRSFNYLMENTDEKVQKYLLHISLAWYITILMANLAFVFEGRPLFYILALLALGANAVFSYFMIYALVKSVRDVRQLKTAIDTDALTGTGSRAAFMQGMEAAVRRDAPFYLVFLDLSRFKQINNRYGHLVGDEYLKFFAKRVVSAAGESGKTYRMSGDEFAVIFGGRHPIDFIEEIEGIADTLDDIPVSFYGCSISLAAYPADGRDVDALVTMANRRIRDEKQKRNGGEGARA